MHLNSRQRKIYYANLYVFGHREEVNGKIEVTKEHSYPLRSSCKFFLPYSMTKSICTYDERKTLCQANRTTPVRTQSTNGCGESGVFFEQELGPSYEKSYETKTGSFTFFLLGLVAVAVWVFVT